MVKTKTADFTIRYFLFMSILYNLWYFIRKFYPIIAERWKDLIEDEMRREREIERLFDVLYTNEIFNCSFFSDTTLSFAYCFMDKVGFL